MLQRTKWVGDPLETSGSEVMWASGPVWGQLGCVSWAPCPPSSVWWFHCWGVLLCGHEMAVGCHLGCRLPSCHLGQESPVCHVPIDSGNWVLLYQSLRPQGRHCANLCVWTGALLDFETFLPLLHGICTVETWWSLRRISGYCEDRERTKAKRFSDHKPFNRPVRAPFRVRF